MKRCPDCKTEEHDGACNWLDWMVVEAGGVCPHCGGPVTEIETVTALGSLMDSLEAAVDEAREERRRFREEYLPRRAAEVAAELSEGLPEGLSVDWGGGDA